MKSRRVEHHLPWDPYQIFDLVADIERYHEFLPGWSDVHISGRESDVLTVVQAIDMGIVRLEFQSRAELTRPERLRVSSTSGPFRHFLLDWQFSPTERNACMVVLEAGIEMHSRLLEAAGGRLLDMMTQDIFRRFHARAVRLYGYPGAGNRQQPPT